ncbi:hypothetical protein BGZ91_008962 [Linnemannia elongata]|nr:hypothetical protein BGZ91_008962 [Linnemannia elongata]
MDPKAPASSGNSDVSPFTYSYAHYSATVPTNAYTKLTACIKTNDNDYFDVRVRPMGTFPRSPSASPLIQLDQRVVARRPLSDLRSIQRPPQSISDYSNNDESVGHSKLE